MAGRRLAHAQRDRARPEQRAPRPRAAHPARESAPRRSRAAAARAGHTPRERVRTPVTRRSVTRTPVTRRPVTRRSLGSRGSCCRRPTSRLAETTKAGSGVISLSIHMTCRRAPTSAALQGQRGERERHERCARRRGRSTRRRPRITRMGWLMTAQAQAGGTPVSTPGGP